MVQELYDEKQMASYLLGQLSDEEAARLEDRGLADHDFFEHLLVVENRLIEAYLTDRLPSPERVQFEASFLASPKRRERVEMTRVLLDSFAKPVVIPTATEGGNWWDRLKAFFQFNTFTVGLATAAALLLFAFAGWSWWEARQVRQEFAQLSRDRATLEQRIQELNAQVAAQQGHNQELNVKLKESEAARARLLAQQSSLESVQPRPMSLFASFVLLTGGMRGPSAPPVSLTLPAQARGATFTLRVEEDLLNFMLKDRPPVRAELYRAGTLQWSQSGLTPRRVKGGRGFVITVPATDLPNGAYQLRLVIPSAVNTTLAEYLFNIERQ